MRTIAFIKIFIYFQSIIDLALRSFHRNKLLERQDFCDRIITETGSEMGPDPLPDHAEVEPGPFGQADR